METKQKSSTVAVLCILAAGCLWGCIGIFNRGIASFDISAPTIAMVRNFGACLVIGALFSLLDRKIFRIKLRHLPLFLGTGVVSVLMFTILYIRCQEVSSLAMSAILLYTAPAFVVVMSAIVFRDKLTKRKLLALFFAFLGCTFAIGLWNGEGLSLSPDGLFFGLGSGFCYALYSIFGRLALRYYHPFAVTFYTFLCAGLASLIPARPSEVLCIVTSPRAILFSLCLVFFSSVIPYLLYTKGLGDLGDSGKASIIASIEPVAASIVGVLVFGEPLGIGILLGLVCILLSVYILR